MYNLVESLEKGKPPFGRKRKPLKKTFKQRQIENLKSFQDKLKTFFLKIRAFFLTITGFGGVFMFYITFNFFLKPSFMTLKAGLQPARCKVTYVNFLEGKRNCSWTSCKMGCTKEDVFTCWQIIVFTQHMNQTNISAEIKPSEIKPTDGRLNVTLIDNFTNEFNFRDDIALMNLHFMKSEGLSKLQISVQGCGYTSCIEWGEEFGKVGKMFSCFVSSDQTLAVPSYDFEESIIKAILGGLPLILSIISLLLMYRLYWRKNATDKTMSLSFDTNRLESKRDEAKLKLLQKLQNRENLPSAESDQTSTPNVNRNFKVKKNKVAPLALYANGFQAESPRQFQPKLELNGIQRSNSSKHFESETKSPKHISANKWRESLRKLVMSNEELSSAEDFTEVHLRH